MKRFCFLIATERSGSNFITALMNGHSQISGPPPTHLFRLFIPNRANYGELSRDANWRALIDDVVANFAAKLGSWETNVTREMLERDGRPRSVEALLRYIYEQEAAFDGAEWIFVKENHTWAFAPFLRDKFPACRFVFLVRDPRDVASSWVSTATIPGGVEAAVTTWLNDQAPTAELLRRWRGERMRLVRYEDLLRDTEGTLAMLTEFLGLAYEPDMLEFNRRRRTARNAERIEAWRNLGRPVMSDNVGNHRELLKEVDREFVELSCFELMVELGYEPELVLERPERGEAGRRLEELRPQLNEGSYEVSDPAEVEIRARRLAAIDQVLERRLP